MKVFVYYDVSGSVPEELFNKFLFEAAWRKSQLRDVEWHEFCFDHKVRPLKGNAWPNYGGGGTDIDAVREHFLSHAGEGDGLLIFSDGYIPELGPIPDHHPMELVFLDPEAL